MATRWRLFAGVTIIVLLVVLGLSRATARELSGANESPSRSRPGEVEAISGDDTEPAPEDEPAIEPPRSDPKPPDSRQSTRVAHPDLLLSAAFSQALVGALLVGLAWYAEVPPDALGIDDPAGAVLPGAALGAGLYAANEAGVWVTVRLGIESDKALRELLTPETRGEWALLLLVVLPVVAGVEEFLFRGALVGALAAGFPVSPWVLAVLSSVAFGLGHGLQGPGGVLVTGVLGFALAAAFVLTGNLWVVVVAHYLVNTLEFLVHEGLGVEWG